MSAFYDRQGNEVSIFEMVASAGTGWDASVGDARVSTVHIGVGQCGGDGPPLIFETMVLGGEHAWSCWRYPSEDAARAGHDAVVAWLRGDGPEPARA